MIIKFLNPKRILLGNKKKSVGISVAGSRSRKEQHDVSGTGAGTATRCGTGIDRYVSSKST
jgi:hypothetical protein